MVSDEDYTNWFKPDGDNDDNLDANGNLSDNILINNFNSFPPPRIWFSNKDISCCPDDDRYCFYCILICTLVLLITTVNDKNEVKTEEGLSSRPLLSSLSMTVPPPWRSRNGWIRKSREFREDITSDGGGAVVSAKTIAFVIEVDKMVPSGIVIVIASSMAKIGNVILHGFLFCLTFRMLQYYPLFYPQKFGHSIDRKGCNKIPGDNLLQSNLGKRFNTNKHIKTQKQKLYPSSFSFYRQTLK